MLRGQPRSIAPDPPSLERTFTSKENAMPISLNVNSGTKVLAQTAVALAAAVSLSGCGTPAPAHADQLALTVINNLATGNVAGATTDFSPAMTQGLPAANLTQTWKHYQDVLGGYKSHGEPQD